MQWACIGESTRLVSEYKNKLQLSEAETSRLDGAVSTINEYNVLYFYYLLGWEIKGASQSL